ncbi:MAG: SufD family Fe-S cluster assembly protein [archaeon]|nr:SufD family Fe-S cluster assembly protein [archaeon]
MQETMLSTKTFEDFLLTRNEPQWLKDYRKTNFEAFTAAKLPQSMYTNLLAIEKQLEIAKENANISFSCSHELKTQGIIVEDFETALKLHESQLRNFLEKETIHHDKFELFSNAFFTQGFFIFTPRNIQKKEIIEISINPKNKSITKGIIALEETANLAILEKTNAMHSNELNSIALSIFLGQATNLDYYNFAELGDNLTHISSKRIFQARDSKLNSFYAWFGGKQVISKVKNHLQGQGAELLHSELATGQQKERYDFNSDIFHEVPETTGKITFKAVLDDFSSSIFDGMIKIFEKAQVTNSFLEAHSILLSKNASSNNIPGLEIEANDVKATHSASVHKIDEEQLFYLNSRGINQREAQKIIVQSFFEALTNRISQENLREIFNNKIEEKYK